MSSAKPGVPANVPARHRGQVLRGLTLGGVSGLAAALLALGIFASSSPGNSGATEAARPPARTRQNVRPLPARLSETGLYAPGSTVEIDPRNLSYAPQYPLWSDGASKRRWFRLPEGQPIDASEPDHFRFPIGTRFWKEFSFGGVRTETRYMELTDAGFRYATYVWNAAGSDAELASERGVRGLPTRQDGVLHDVPSQSDCGACHAGKLGPVLGFGALQLSPDRDPLAVHAEPLQPGDVDLAELARRGLVIHLPPRWLESPPRIAAASPNERATLGYLFANCAHCHNGEGPLAPLGLDFDQLLSDATSTERVRNSSVAQASQYRLPGAERSLRVAPGRPHESTLAFRMRSLAATARMPPLGTRRVDVRALERIERWITEDL